MLYSNNRLDEAVKIEKIKSCLISSLKRIQTKHGMNNIASTFCSDYIQGELLFQPDSAYALLPVSEGKVVDLKTKSTRDRTREDLFTYELKIPYNPDIKSEGTHIEKFLAELMLEQHPSGRRPDVC